MVISACLFIMGGCYCIGTTKPNNYIINTCNCLFDMCNCCCGGGKQKTLELGKVYTVDTSMNTTEDRVYVKENKRFSFLKSRFELVEE